MKTHPDVGYDIVKGIAFPWPVATMIHQHHERMDGSGYPHGLKGTEILLKLNSRRGGHPLRRWLRIVPTDLDWASRLL